MGDRLANAGPFDRPVLRIFDDVLVDEGAKVYIIDRTGKTPVIRQGIICCGPTVWCTVFVPDIPSGFVQPRSEVFATELFARERLK